MLTKEQWEKQQKEYELIKEIMSRPACERRRLLCDKSLRTIDDLDN